MRILWSSLRRNFEFFTKFIIHKLPQWLSVNELEKFSIDMLKVNFVRSSTKILSLLFRCKGKSERVNLTIRNCRLQIILLMDTTPYNGKDKNLLLRKFLGSYLTSHHHSKTHRNKLKYTTFVSFQRRKKFVFEFDRKISTY